MGILKGFVILLLVVFLASGFVASGVSARLEARWMLQAGDIVAGEDVSVQHPMATLFHQQTARVSDLEDTHLSFPGALGFNAPGGPGQGVSLALPSISQQVNVSTSSSSTGFFKANWAYISDLAQSNLGSGPLGLTCTAQRPFKNSRMLGSEYIWPLMTPGDKK